MTARIAKILTIVAGLAGIVLLLPGATIVYWVVANSGPGVNFEGLPMALMAASLGGGFLVVSVWAWVSSRGPDPPA
jgi:uncharacterized membrane protein YjjB (DUF3815 family)